MSKNIIINGKNMKLKYLEGLKVNGNEAVIVRNNYSVMYNKYVIVIQHKDGLLSEYYSDDNEVKKIKLYISYDKPNELIFENPDWVASNKLQGKVAIVTGGDSGIGRAVSILFAKEGADIAIVYFNERQDANQTKQIIEGLGRRCLLLEGDLRYENFSSFIAQSVINAFGRIDILVNNAAVQFPQNSILDISAEQLRNTFETNIFSVFYLTKAVLPYLEANSSIINTSSVTAFEGHKSLIDYSCTKGAITVFTKSLALSTADSKIRVNYFVYFLLLYFSITFRILTSFYIIY